MGDPKKVTRGDKGRDPISGRGDITPKIATATIFLTVILNFLSFLEAKLKKIDGKKSLMCQKYSCFLNSKNYNLTQ